MKIPVTIFTGFLGAGKTTIISSLLKQCPERRIVVIVNEFGNISLDGPSIANASADGDIEIIDFTGELIAYSSDDKFDQVLEALAQRGSEIDHVIVETSGLAAPTAVCERLALGSKKFALDAVITVVDAAELPLYESSTLSKQQVFDSQLAAADIVVLNKIDGIPSDRLPQLEERLRALSPTVRFVEPANEGKVNHKLLLSMHLYSTRQMQALGVTHAQPETEQKDEPHSHDGWGPHEHGLRTHQHLHTQDPGWLSFVLHCHDKPEFSVIQNAIKQVVDDQPLFRVKGYVETADCGLQELQCVGNRVRLSAPPAATDRQDKSEIVFIGYNVVRDRVATTLSQSTNSQWH